jgi:hypothetical protein
MLPVDRDCGPGVQIGEFADDLVAGAPCRAVRVEYLGGRRAGRHVHVEMPVRLGLAPGQRVAEPVELAAGQVRHQPGQRGSGLDQHGAQLIVAQPVALDEHGLALEVEKGQRRLALVSVEERDRPAPGLGHGADPGHAMTGVRARFSPI